MYDDKKEKKNGTTTYTVVRVHEIHRSPEQLDPQRSISRVPGAVPVGNSPL